MIIPYLPQSRVERLIAAGRVFLAASSLLAIFLDPSEPSKFAESTYALLALYLASSLLLALLVWNTPDALMRFRLATHVFDLAAFTVFMYLTEGPGSPFFVYFVFSLLCGTLRWQWQGTLWTTVGALATFLAMGGYAAEILKDPTFELNRFIIRSVYLVVVAFLLGYLGTYEARTRRDISQVTGWTPPAPDDLREVVQQGLEHAAAVFRGTRLVVVWEEPDEPWIHVVSRGSQAPDWSRERAGSLQPMVAAPLAEQDFVIPNARARVPVALYNTPEGFQRWHGMSLHPELGTRLAAGSVLALRLTGVMLDGRLFVLDLPRVSIDDLMLGEILARQLSTPLDQFYLLRRLKEAVVDRERVSLARDLHDGFLQSLTGMALLLHTVPALLDGGSVLARARIHEIQHLLSAQQRSLRSMIRRLEPIRPDVVEAQSTLTSAIEDLVTQVELEWGVHVEVKTTRLATPLSESLLVHLVHLVREALVNAVRHGRASFVRVEAWTDDEKIHVTVADNGRGFPFKGRHDLAALTELKIGPATLKDRIGSLDGDLVIDSYESGASLEITLPVEPGSA